MFVHTFVLCVISRIYVLDLLLNFFIHSKLSLLPGSPVGFGRFFSVFNGALQQLCSDIQLVDFFVELENSLIQYVTSFAQRTVDADCFEHVDEGSHADQSGSLYGLLLLFFLFGLFFLGLIVGVLFVFVHVLGDVLAVKLYHLLFVLLRIMRVFIPLIILLTLRVFVQIIADSFHVLVEVNEHS